MATAAPDVDFECPVCHEDYDQPKFLPCMHVVCRKCIISWLSAQDQGGCPLCRAPILPTHQPKPADLNAAVDTLPTDLATKALIESHHVLSGDTVCNVCDDVSATTYCLQCGVKLCKSCAKGHKRYPAFQEHELEDLKSLSAARLAANRRSPCDLHLDKIAEAYCRDHKTAICLLCSTTHHRACAGVGTVGDVAVLARGEFQQQAQRLRNREADVTRNKKQLDQTMRDALTHFSTCHAEVKATFSDLRRQLDKREQEIAAQLQQHQDDVMSRMQAEKIALEQQRVSIAAHARSVERLIVPSPDSALLGMLEKLKARLDDLETQQQTPGGAANTAMKSAVFDKDVVTRLMREIGALGEVTYKEKAPSVVTPVQPAMTQPAMTQPAMTQPAMTQPAMTQPALTQPAKTEPAKTEPAMTQPAMTQQATKQPQATGGGGKPTGAELAKVLKMGDRVRRGPGWVSLRGDAVGGGSGTVTAVLSRRLRAVGRDPSGCVDVRWDNGLEGTYYMGFDDLYELQLV